MFFLSGGRRDKRRCGARRAATLVARADQLEVAPHVETIATGDFILVQGFFSDRMVLAINLGVAARSKAPLRRALDDLAARSALAGVVALDAGVLGPGLDAARALLDVRIVAGAPAWAFARALTAATVL